jgi:hypothetical protein
MLHSAEKKMITTTLTVTMAALDLSLYNVLFGTDLKKSGDNTKWASTASFKKRQM